MYIYIYIYTHTHIHILTHSIGLQHEAPALRHRPHEPVLGLEYNIV